MNPIPITRLQSRLPLLFLLSVVAVSFLSVPAQSADLKSLEPVLKRDQLDRAATLLAPMLKQDKDDSEVWQAMGEVEWRRGNTMEAEKDFQKALELDPGSARAMAGLGLVALDNGDMAKAEAQGRAALEKDDDEWLAHYVMARVFLARGDKNRAFEHIEKGKKKKGRLEDADLFESAVAMLARADHDIERAENGFIKARGMAQNTVEHIMNLADHYEETEQWGNAVNLFRALGPAAENSAKLSYRMGRAMEHQQRYQEAFQQYQKAVVLDSTYAPALGAMGHLLLLDSRRTAQALVFLEKAVAIRPTFQNRLDLGLALTRLGRADEAVPHLKAANEENDDPTSRAALALAYVNSKDHADQGLAMFEGDIDVRLEASADDMVDVGRAYISKKEYAAARKWLDMALEKEPGHVEAQYRIAYIDLINKDYEAAIKGIEAKLKADPRNASAWSRLGIAQQGSGNLPEAIKAYRRAAELSPKTARLWNQLAAALSQANQLDDAAVAYSRALQVSPQDNTALRGRGFTYLVQEKYALAIRDLQAAAQVDPSNVDTMVYLGQARLNNGQINEAKVAFEKAVELDPSNADALEGLDVINSRR
jgi:tetratricopeptide (TPR) repeat protein